MDIFFDGGGGTYYINILVSQDLNIDIEKIKADFRLITDIDSINKSEILVMNNFSNKIHLKREVGPDDLLFYLKNDLYYK